MKIELKNPLITWLSSALSQTAATAGHSVMSVRCERFSRRVSAFGSEKAHPRAADLTGCAGHQALPLAV
jgi:hypothetical protein